MNIEPKVCGLRAYIFGLVPADVLSLYLWAAAVCAMCIRARGRVR